MHRNHLILSTTLFAVLAALGWRAQRGGAPTESAPRAEATASEPLPRLVELGSDACASCRAMIPVLAELREVHAGELEVEFIDVWEFPELAAPYEVRVIPTQVFLAPDGSELERHQGFFAAAAIRERWSDLGFPLEQEHAAP